MKKFLVMIMAVAAIVFVSCNNKSEKATEDAGASIEAAVNDLQALIDGGDASALSAALEAVQDKAKEIAASVDAETAKTYLEKIKELVVANAEKIKALVSNDAINNLVDGIANLDVDNTVSQFVDAAKAAGVGAATDAVEAGNEAVEAAKEGAEAVKEAVEAAPEAAKEAAEAAKDAAVDAAKEKANEAIDKGVSDAKKKLGL